MMLSNRELVRRAELCLVNVFPDIVKDCPKLRNLPKIFLRSFKNVDPLFYIVFITPQVIKPPVSRSSEMTIKT